MTRVFTRSVSKKSFFCNAKRKEWLTDEPSFTLVWYSRTIQVPSGVDASQRALLHFGAVDYEATVFVSGSQVGNALATLSTPSSSSNWISCHR